MTALEVTYIGYCKDDKYYDKSGTYIGSIRNGCVYNRTGSIIGAFSNIPYKIAGIVFLYGFYLLR